MSDDRSILVPYDFSGHSRAALFAATDLARRLGADLHVLHVIQPPAFAYGFGSHAGAVVPPPVDLAQVGEGALKSLRELLEDIGDFPGRVEPHVVEASSIADAIVAFAEQRRVDLIAMGTHGRTGLAHVFLGSVAERTLRRAPCPVLTVQGPEEDGGDA